MDVQQALSLMQGTLKSVKVLETFSDSTLDNSDLSNVGFWPKADSIATAFPTHAQASRCRSEVEFRRVAFCWYAHAERPAMPSPSCHNSAPLFDKAASKP